MLAVLALAGAVILLSFRPEALLVSWLALAPFLQEFGSHCAIGHPLTFALYRAPPLVFLLWTLTAPTRMRPFGVARRPGFVDALPAAYFLFVLGSMAVTGQFSAASLKVCLSEHRDRSHPLLLRGVRTAALSRVEPSGKGCCLLSQCSRR